ncbi:hypothetical protein BI49514_02397 [Brevibacterium iodinum ATCC 49514]|uniref:Uncharacterized protein n=1 Tax=Brevibacterium iodinum ATCC 49514 TaxID=1255616 RepID=A0A2H1JV41_9MICO|nr:hypothetical protein BI49514_02397 [Brevibacterium iodinum ATCC 49514]SUW70169.1 Uncharacterised protein [Brevibacterium iodinum]
MSASEARSKVLKYASRVVKEVRYYPLDVVGARAVKRREEEQVGLGPVDREELDALSERPMRNELAAVKRMRLGDGLIAGFHGIPMFWAMGCVFTVLLMLGGPWSVFSGSGFGYGFLGGVLNGMAGAAVTGVLYLLEFQLARAEKDSLANYCEMLEAGAASTLVGHSEILWAAELISEAETSMREIQSAGLSTTDAETKLVRLVELSMMLASSLEQIIFIRTVDERILTGLTDAEIQADDDLWQIWADNERTEIEFEATWADWQSTQRELIGHVRGLSQEARRAKALLEAAGRNAQRRTREG